jgi:hypothetical protein
MKFTRFPRQILASAGLCAVAAALWNPVPASAQTLAAPTSAPTTQIASAADRQLIVQLGAEDFKVREAASEQLRNRGSDALPAIREGAQSKDPEVQTRCLALIKELDDKAKALADAKKNGAMEDLVINGQVVGNIRIAPNMQVNTNFVNVGAGASIQMVTIGNLIFTLQSNPDGLVILVNLGGGPPKIYRAKSVDDLKNTDPEGYKIYQQVFAAKANAAGAAAPQPAIRPQPGPIRVAPRQAPPQAAPPQPAPPQPASQPSR